MIVRLCATKAAATVAGTSRRGLFLSIGISNDSCKACTSYLLAHGVQLLPQVGRERLQ